MTIGERIKKRRIDLQMSQDELAKKVGYKSRSSINKIELARELPLKKVEAMARALECTPSYLMGWTDEEQAVIDHMKEKIESLGNNEQGYYLDEETARIAQEVFENPDTRMLFDAARGAKPEDIKMAAEMLRRFKETNHDV